MKDTMVDGSETADGAAFSQALSALKERGSNLLVVGGALEGAHVDACDRLLGEDVEQRRRVFVSTDGTSGSLSVARPATPDRARVVTRTTSTRSIAAESSPAMPSREVTDPDLGELASMVDDAITDVEPREGFEPAELRVCFDSLLPLFSDHEEEAVFRMLNLVTSRVRTHDGMGHYHFPVDVQDEVVRVLEPLFDAVIELRRRDGVSEHNWRLVEDDVESGWLPL